MLLRLLPAKVFNLELWRGQMRLAGSLLLVWAAAVLSNPAAASPINGEMNIAGSLTATSTSLNFLNGTTEGTGGFVTLQGGTGYFNAIASTNLMAPYIGAAKNLTSNPSNVTDSLSGFTAPGYSGLSIDLNQIVAPTASPCTGSEAANASCSLGSLTLTNLGGDNTELAMVVSGTAHDSAVADSTAPITGRYTTQTGQNIGALMTAFAGNGITASYSANFNTAQAPEPELLLMLGIGLAATGMLRRKAVVVD